MSVLVVASDDHLAHDPRTQFVEHGQPLQHPEVPARAARIHAALSEAPWVEVTAPRRGDNDDVLARVHTRSYLEFLEHAHERWRTATGLGPESEAVAYARALRGQPFDGHGHVIAELGWYSHDDDPILAGTWPAARAAVDLASTAWAAVADAHTRVAYALTRPPGHHAASSSFGGYCYLNNAAVVAQSWTDRGARVAIVDLDYHHGNGTQEIFWTRDDVLFVSLHADPLEEYPFLSGFAPEQGAGAGAGATRNYPMPHGTTWGAYGPALDDALGVVRDFAPDGVVVSLGVDTALEDPHGFGLTADDFTRMGARLAALDRPTVVVQEGGYDLGVIGRNVAAVLREFA